MGLIIKELCKAKGLSIKDIADKLGLDQSNLSSSIKGNPTLGRLQDIAKVLGVEVYDLFDRKDAATLNGFVEVKGEIYKISNAADWINAERNIEGLVQIPVYSQFEEMRKEVASFVKDCIKKQPATAFTAGRVGSKELFTLIYDNEANIFFLALSGQSKVYKYDMLEYQCFDKLDLDSSEGVIKNIINDIEAVYEPR